MSEILNQPRTRADGPVTRELDDLKTYGARMRENVMRD